METTSADEAVKAQVHDYWNARPCGTQFTRLRWGSPEFFANVEQNRYASHPFMREVAEFDAFAGQRVLEIGCGLGTDLINFARGGAAVSGIDLTESSIELVKRRFAAEGREVDARVGDAEHLPFPDESFDAVYSFGVLHHTPDIERAGAEVYRVLRPGGRIIIMLYHRDSLRVWLGAPLYGAKQLLRSDFRLRAAVSEWIRVYDGRDNPLGRAYTRSEVDHIFGRFHQRRYSVCHPVRLSLPRVLQTLNQKLLAPWAGFFLVLKARK